MPKVTQKVNKSFVEEKVKLSSRQKEVGLILEVYQRRINDIQAEANPYVAEFNANKKRLDEIDGVLNPKEEATKEEEVKS